MVISARAILTMGLCSVGLALLVGPSLGQQSDTGVRRTANTTATNPAVPVPPVIGTIDMDRVFKEYEKVKSSSEEFKAAAQARKADLVKIQGEAQAEAEILAKLTPGTDDFRKHETRVTELKARFEAGREQAERDFASREAEAMATLYKEIQAMVARVAQWRKMTYVVKVSNQPISGSNPNSVMAAMANTMVYADPRNDVTNDVVFNLNRMYKATGGTAPKTSAGASSPAGGVQLEQDVQGHRRHGTQDLRRRLIPRRWRRRSCSGRACRGDARRRKLKPRLSPRPAIPIPRPSTGATRRSMG
jgi:outer membrane protein